MLLNDDLSVRTLVDPQQLQWLQSPTKGVERRMLFRIGDEQARATSIVRYAPRSHFPRHTHWGGEEIFVLEGTFQDETGDFPAGTYLRNPPGSAHEPASESGCTLFVKLWQFSRGDRERIVRRPGEARLKKPRTGAVSSAVLFDSHRERVLLEQWAPNAAIEIDNIHGLELLVVEGDCIEAKQILQHWSWLRLPAGQPLRARVGANGARVWCKVAPLMHEDVCAFDAAKVVIS